jgi:FAD/FMN-containing dehydrogenase
MNELVIHEDSNTVEVGAGLTWIEVYAALVPKGINVVGGRLPDIGVGGYMLGGGDSLFLMVHRMDGLIEVGGYSWKTNQFGLAVDNVVAFELVLPSGQVKVVTEKDQDLWFALRVCRSGIGEFKGNGLICIRVDLTTM